MRPHALLSLSNEYCKGLTLCGSGPLLSHFFFFFFLQKCRLPYFKLVCYNVFLCVCRGEEVSES